MQGIKQSLGFGQHKALPYRVEVLVQELVFDHSPDKQLARKVFEPYISVQRNDETATRKQTFTKSGYDIGRRPPIGFDQTFELCFDKDDSLVIQLYNSGDAMHPHQIVACGNYKIQDLITPDMPTTSTSPDTPLCSRSLEIPLTETVGKLDKVLSHLPGSHHAPAAPAADAQVLGRLKLRLKLFNAPVSSVPGAATSTTSQAMPAKSATTQSSAVGSVPSSSAPAQSQVQTGAMRT